MDAPFDFSAPEPSFWDGFREAGNPQPFRAGRLIYLQGQEPQYLYYLRDGLVRTFIASEEGEEKTLTLYRPGSIFGEAALFDGLPRMSSAIAQTDCTLSLFDREAVLREFSKDPTLVQNMLTYLSRTVRMLSDQVDHMSFLSAGQRVARYLLSLPSDGGVLHISQDEIAAAVSASRVSVSRLLRSFAAEGLLETGYRCVILTNPDGLREKTKLV